MRCCSTRPDPGSPGRRRFGRGLLGVCATLHGGLGASAFAASSTSAWPAQPIRLVVAQAPGGPPDLIARHVAEPLSRALGVPVVVDNQPGASGVIGIRLAAHAAPDGYTLVIGTLSTHVLVPLADPGAGYDPVRDFAPVANLFHSIKVLWVGAAVPARTLPEWLRLARANPGVYNFASGGVGSSNHVDMALFLATAGLDLVHVPYNGPAAAIASLATGDTQAMIVSIGTGLPLMQAGRVRPLAVFATQRVPQLPGVPTAAELGWSAVDLAAWIGLFAPAATPPAIVDRLNRELASVLGGATAAAWAREQGLEIAGGTPAALGAALAADTRRWSAALARLQLTPPRGAAR